MKRILLLLLLCVPVAVAAQSKKVKKANEETAQWRYEIEPVAVGNQGNVVVKVWSHSKSPQVAQEQSKKNAVHGVVFKGIPTKDRLPGRKPLVAEAGQEDSAFFKDFFKDGGDYMRFVTLTNSGAVASGDVMKTSKKEYKVGVQVTVNYNDLRSFLESKGVVKRLDSGF